MTYTVETRIGKDWAGVSPGLSRSTADVRLADLIDKGAEPGRVRIVTDTGDVVTYGDSTTILQPGEQAPLPSTPEGKRVREHGYTLDQKREARAAHADLLAQALDHLTTPAGMSAWLVAREIHLNITPGNAALAGLQAPGLIVGSRRQWKAEGIRIPKGCSHSLRLTGRAFWPQAAWTIEDLGGTMPEGVPVPDAGHCERLARSWGSWANRSAPGLTAWIEAEQPELIEGEAVQVEREEQEIPF